MKKLCNFTKDSWLKNPEIAINIARIIKAIIVVKVLVFIPKIPNKVSSVKVAVTTFTHIQPTRLIQPHNVGI